MQWPDHFPQNCPPEDAREPSEQVYRLISQDSPTPEDFKTVREQNPGRPFPENEKECRACAVSVYTSIDDLSRINRRTGRFRNAKVAVGNLTSELGQIKHTPSPPEKNNSHHSWWVPTGVKAYTLFKAVEVT